MQVAREKGFEKRVQFYVAKTYYNQLEDYYADFKKIFIITILKHNLFTEEVNYISKHNIRNEQTNIQCLHDFRFIFIELSKFNRKYVDDLKNAIERWCFFKYTKNITNVEIYERLQNKNLY